MPILLRCSLVAIALLPALQCKPALACSVVQGYRVPTSLELVQRADMIILGTAESHVPGAGQGDEGEVVIRPTELLKGDGLPAEVRVSGWLSDEPRFVIASNPRDLENPNPGALMGGCVRYIFKQGMLLLLFLKRDGEGRLRLASYPFARSAEDVPSRDALWARAVRLYAEVAALPESQQKAALIAKRDILRAGHDDLDAALLAKDINRQIKRRRIAPWD